MKKSLWIGLLAVVIAALAVGAYFFINSEKEEKFVNPLFYKKMFSGGKTYYEVQITPTSVYIMEFERLKHNYKCKMTNNQMTTVTLACQVFDMQNNKEITRSYTYTLKPCTEANGCLDKGGWLVEQKITPYMDTFLDNIYIIPSQMDNKPEDRFENPLFYKKLSPISRQSRPTYLTPNSLTYFDTDNQKVVEKCKMLENTPMFVTLECSFYNELSQKQMDYVVRFILEKCDEQKRSYCFDGKWFVVESRRSGGFATFVIKDKDMGQN